MCGICGFVGEAEPDLIVRMTDSLRHRGPDDHGYFRHGRVQLGHRRLSVIDIAGGHQPMVTSDGSMVIVYNGEIYNFRELRDRLSGKGYGFETSSDTEVLLRTYQDEGAGGLRRLGGMFAFAIYDRRQDELFLARDRIGIKPLYYVEIPNGLVFASEIKALLHHPGWSPTINPRAIHDYLALRYIPGETTIFNEVKRLPAAHYLVYRRGRLSIHRYWEPPSYDPTVRRSEDDYLDELAQRLETSVRRRMISDVSLGAYLSGGLDSSVVVALMSRMVDRPVKTFSVGFDYEHDELREAAFTAKHLGCDHHEVDCGAGDVELLPEIVYQMDEPMGDPITIPMYKLAREAKKEVTVILTGEGGDEIFAGYLFHKVMALGELYRRLTPSVVRRWIVSPLLAVAPARAMNLAFQYPAYLGNRGKRKVLDYHDLLDPSRIDAAYRHLISLFDARDVAELYTPEFREQLGTTEAPRLPTDGPAGEPYLNRLIHLQFPHWLPDNMLLRQDKTGMASAIEGRVPYLDHELVEFAMKLPPALKLRGMTGKYLLRRFAERVLPKEVVRRKKMPFYFPIENSFQRPQFRALMEELLGARSVEQRGIFRVEAVAGLKAAMDRREFLVVKQIFSLMVLELWFRVFVDRSISIPVSAGTGVATS